MEKNTDMVDAVAKAVIVVAVTVVAARVATRLINFATKKYAA